MSNKFLSSKNDVFNKLAKKSPSQLINDIFETAQKINKMDGDKEEPANNPIQTLIDNMMSKDKKDLFEDTKGKQDGRDLDGSKGMDHSEMDPINHSDMAIEAESNLEDAINNFDSNLYKVDPHGDWMENEWMSIEDYMNLLLKKYGRNIVYAPAAIDANHIAFDSPDGFQIINMVHKSHWDTGK